MSSIEEFQVIILAGGFGKHLTPLADHIPKALLPVANRPLLSYQLEMLESAGFSSVLIMTRNSSEEQIRHFISKVYRGPLKTELMSAEDYVGTAQALVRIRDKIKKDFIVISGDLIADGSFIHGMIDAHRLKETAVTVLVKEKLPEDPATPPIGKKKKKVLDFVGTAEDSKRLVFLASSEDYEESFSFKRAILSRFPHMTLATNMMDPHFYIFSHWALDLLEKKKSASLKHDFIPFLLKLQYRADLRKEFGVNSKPDIEMLMTSTLTDTSDTVFCQAFTVEQKHYCIRANTFLNYMDANRDIATGLKCFIPNEPEGKKNFVSASATVGATQIGPECVVSDGTVIGDKCSIKKSIIGKHCQIGENAKILNSVILDHVKIRAGSKIQNSIVCGSVEVLERCDIVDSVVAPELVVEVETHIKREVYMGKKESEDSDDE